MRLCRRAPGSHPAPVPRCRGGAARWKGVRPRRVPYPCRRVHRVPVRQRKAFSGRLRATDSERARGGGSGTRARASLSGFRGMTGSRPAQRTVWTNPALWSATNQGNFFFSGQGPVGGAGILHGRRAVRAYFRTASRTRWAGSESGEKKGRGEGRGRAVTVGRYGSVDRQGCRTGPRRKRLLSFLTYAGIPCRKREPQAVYASPTLHSVSACPGPTDHCMLATIQDRAVVCRKICPAKARWEGEGV